MEKHFDYGCDIPKDPCAKYKLEAIEEREESLEYVALAKQFANQAEAIEFEIRQLLSKVKELNAKAEELWYEHDEAEAEAYRLLEASNKSLERYIECKEHNKKPCPTRPCPTRPCPRPYPRNC